MTDTTVEKPSQNKMVVAVVGALLAAAIGFVLIGPKKSAEKQTTDLLNLPAVVEKVDSNESDIKENRESAATDLKDYRRINQDERNRREGEMKQYVDTLDTKKRERIEDLRQYIWREEDIEREYLREFREAQSELNKLLLDHINTPPSGHDNG